MTYSFPPSITVTSEGACKGLLFYFLPKSPLPSFTKSLTDFTNAFKFLHFVVSVFVAEYMDSTEGNQENANGQQELAQFTQGAKGIANV